MTNNNKIIESIIYGRKYSELIENFRKDLYLLDQKYPDILELNDKFINHCNIVTDPPEIFLSFSDEIIPPRIRKEIVNLFYSYFGKHKDNNH